MRLARHVPSVRAVDIEEARGLGNAFPFVEVGLVLAWAIANLFTGASAVSHRQRRSLASGLMR